ncbi:MAG: CoA transferase [Novosphingobium sp.]|nr:CoA transferase [Novosphingobium sp.]
MTVSAPELPLRTDQPSGPRPLDGVRVIDFTRVLAGPFGTQILGDLGAEVIKIENPLGGDDTRMLWPEPGFGGETSFFMSLNRSKRSVAIDLKSEAGLEVVFDLLATADVLVENFAGSVMPRFGLDYDSLKERFPQLIYCSVSGYGRSGSNANAAGYDTPLSAETGNIALNAYQDGEPVMGAITYTDISTALNSTIGVLAALHARDRTGRGQHVDVAMFDAALANLSFLGAGFLATGQEPRLNTQRTAGPSGLWETADGQITITSGNPKMFVAFCERVVEKPEWLKDPRFATMQERIQTHAEAFTAELAPILKAQTSAYWSERCKGAGVPCGVLRSAGEALLSSEASERGIVFNLPHPVAGQAPVIAQPVRFSDTPCQYGVPPVLGEHTNEVLSGLLGYSEERIAELETESAIACGSVDAAKAK